MDRVGFPKDYATTMRVLYVYDRPDNKQVRTIYANEPVMSNPKNAAYIIKRGCAGR